MARREEAQAEEAAASDEADALPSARNGTARFPKGQRPDLAALRERVAAIVGTGLHRLEAPAEAPRPNRTSLAESLSDEGLTEIHASQTRGGGSAAGLVLALATRLGASSSRPLLWISQGFGLHEAGRLYAPGLQAFGFDPGDLIQVETGRLDEAVWAAEEAARSGALACAVLEVRGNPGQLSLDGTRRLHVRAREAGVPLFLLRQGAVPEPTAAPLRLRVEAMPALGVAAIGPAGERLIGHPVFSVAVEKSRDGRTRRLLLEWNPHDRRLQTVEPRPLPVAAFSLSFHRPDVSREADRETGSVVALRRAS
jgi:protein ImuA